MQGKFYIPSGELTGMGYWVSNERIATEPDLNDTMTPEQKVAFVAFMQGEEVAFTPDGKPIIPNQDLSVQTPQEAHERIQERETGLGA